MSFFKKLKSKLFKSSSKLEEGLDAIVGDGGVEEEVADAPVVDVQAEAREAEQQRADEAARLEAEAARLEEERLAAEAAAKAQADAAAAEARRLEEERLEQERLEQARVEAERVEAERLAAEQRAAADREAARLAAEAEAERARVAEEAAKAEAARAAAIEAAREAEQAALRDQEEAAAAAQAAELERLRQEEEAAQAAKEAAERAAQEAQAAERARLEEQQRQEAAQAAERAEQQRQLEAAQAAERAALQAEQERKQAEAATQAARDLEAAEAAKRAALAAEADALEAAKEAERAQSVRDEVFNAPSETAEVPAAKPGLFGRLLGRGEKKTVIRRELDDDMLEALEELLISSDMGVDTALRVTANMAEGRFGKRLSTQEIKELLSAEIAKIMEPVAKPMPIYPKRPQVVLVVGVNGSGKTTTIGKLALQFSNAGKKVVIAAGDTFRAAAVEQLQVWGDRAGVPVLTAPEGSDPASLAYEAMEKAEAEGADLLLIDTAGRLQNRSDLMEELAKIVRVIRKKDDTAPHNTLLVLDATTGQNALNQVEVFQQISDVSGLVMTKLDGTAKGGVLVALADKFGLPIHAIGVGEQIDDLDAFDPEDFAQALTGATTE